MIHKLQQGSLLLALALLVLFIAACGGGGGGGGGLAGGGIGGSGITSGTVTGFGSIFVNGIEFETGGASLDVDDKTHVSTGSNDDKFLGIGMVVTVVGTVNADGVSGTAESVLYDDDITGPVAAAPDEDADGITKTFEIFGTTVVADRNATVFEKTTYVDLAQNVVLEVSGYFDGAGVLHATRVEREELLVPGVSEVEIKGTVSGFDGVDTFAVSGITVTFDGTTGFEGLPGSVENGQFVEVQGVLDAAGDIAATRIQLEDDGFDTDVDEASIEGLVTDFNGADDFRVAGQRVDASSAKFEPASLASSLADGVQVEVEGAINGGVLNAGKVEQRSGELRVSAVVDSSNNAAGTITLAVVPGQLVTVFTDTRTLFEDKRDDAAPFGVGDIQSGDFLEVRGYQAGNGDFLAAEVERDQLDDTVLRGPADVPETDGSTAAGTVAILGVSLATDGATDFQDGTLSGTDFFLQVRDGDLVSVKDKDPADGSADEVDFED